MHLYVPHATLVLLSSRSPHNSSAFPLVLNTPISQHPHVVTALCTPQAMTGTKREMASVGSSVHTPEGSLKITEFKKFK